MNDAYTTFRFREADTVAPFATGLELVNSILNLVESEAQRANLNQAQCAHALKVALQFVHTNYFSFTPPASSTPEPNQPPSEEP